jgi:hypothetical protein
MSEEGSSHARRNLWQQPCLNGTGASCPVPFVFAVELPLGRVAIARRRNPLNSSLIGKIEKARRYADERDRRIRFDSFTVSVHGENEAHQVSLEGSRLTCACDFFGGWGVCSHTMALERVLGPMLPAEARTEAREAMAQPA